jgi:predicted nucleic acid-binding Zn ribbon protein
MLVFDYRCPGCDRPEGNVLVEHADDEVICPTCGAAMTRLAVAPHIFSTIVPVYPGSDKRTAGGVHKNKHERATKLQIGYGGGQSPENPKGSK